LRVLSRLTRPAALASVALCSLALLTACGDSDSSSEKEASGFDAVSISGSFGELPTFDWKAALKPGKTESEVLEEGDGAVLEDGDQVVINIAVSDDFSQEVAIDTYGDENSGAVLTVGEKAEPQQAIDLFTQLVGEQVKAGMKVGTRIAVTADVKKEFGQTALALNTVNIGNEDGVAVVADLAAVPLDGPDGKAKTPAAWAPKLVSTKGVPSALDSSDIPKPDVKAKDVRTTTLIEGTGPKVEKGDLAVVNYLGQAWGATKPFDNGFEKKDVPLQVNMNGSTGPGISVIEGWYDALEGVPVGSRILVEIPPAKGYGKKGQAPKIKGDDILYFVIDVLATS
jgi:peptidylprolyl isomerase